MATFCKRDFHILQPLARRPISLDCIVHLRDRYKDGLLVFQQDFVRLQLLRIDERIQAAEIEERQVTAWSDRPDRTMNWRRAVLQHRPALRSETGGDGNGGKEVSDGRANA